MTTLKVIPDIPTNPDALPVKYYVNPYNGFRRAKLVLFSSVLREHKQYLDIKYDDRLLLVEKLERSCFNHMINKANIDNIPIKWDDERFRDIYHVLCAKISSNISQSGVVKNTYLPNAILSGMININDLPKMSSQDLFPDIYRDVISKIEKSKNVTQTVCTSSMYKCRRCHKNECTIENRYNRSLDEGVNLSVTCVACGYEWNA